MMKFKTSDFYEIISHSVPGPSQNTNRAEKIRLFVILTRYLPDQIHDKRRLVNILAAVVCPDYIWAVCDFA